MEFTDKEKIQLADKISQAYFSKNFGTMSKSDLETLLFSEYIDHYMDSEEPYDDYTLSKELGITQTRVRALKERKLLKYPYNVRWEKEFAKAVEKARYDQHNKRVRITIEDVNVMNEVRHFIEQKGWYDEYSLNKKLLSVTLDCFIEICFNDQDEKLIFTEEARKNVQKIKCSDKKEALTDFINDFSKDGLKALLGRAGKETIKNVIKSISGHGVSGSALNLLSVIIK